MLSARAELGSWTSFPPADGPRTPTREQTSREHVVFVDVWLMCRVVCQPVPMHVAVSLLPLAALLPLMLAPAGCLAAAAAAAAFRAAAAAHCMAAHPLKPAAPAATPALLHLSPYQAAAGLP